ncbi:MAG: TlpA family protein disulfide reductase [Bacteroidota bacterium]
MDFKFTDLAGNQVVFSAKEFAQQPHLFLFYHTHCLGCTGRAIPLAYQIQQENKSLKVILIHVEFRTENLAKEEILSVFTTEKSPLPIYRDHHHKVYDFVQAEGTPFWVLIDTKAQLAKKFFGSQANAQNRLHYAIREVIEG